MMKKNNNSGITMVALVITIILIGIITSVLVYFGNNIVKKANLQTASIDMLLIQAKAETIYEKLSFEKTGAELEDALTGVKVTTGTAEATFLTSLGIGPENIVKYFLWNKETLDASGLSGIKLRENEVFYIKYGEEIEVISSIGYKHSNGTTYYKLSEIKDLKEE